MIAQHQTTKYLYLSILFLFILSLLIDSGGGIGGLRSVTLGLVIAISLLIFINPNLRLTKEHSLVLFAFLALPVWGVFSGILNEIPFLKTFTYSLFLIAVPIFYFFFRLFSKEEVVDKLVSAGAVFVFLLLFIHIVIFTQFLLPADLIITLLSNNFEGFFHSKNFFGFNYYVIYFQTTLLFAVFAIVFYTQKKYKLYMLAIFVLFISTSRFGLFVAILIPLVIQVFGYKAVSRLSVYGFIFLPVLIIVMYGFVYLTNYETYNLDPYWGLSSLEARVAHTLSTFDSFNSIKHILIGQGPGSLFYTIRCNCFVDNTELSQLEYIRKFGLIGYLGLHSILFYIVYKNHRFKLYDLNVFILAAYFVSLSNPVLTSLVFSILLSLSLRSQIKRTSV